MKRSYSRGLVAAMEDEAIIDAENAVANGEAPAPELDADGNPIVPVAVIEEVVPDNAESVETELVDLAEVEDVIEDTIEDTEVAEDVIDELEGLETVATESLKNGGFSEKEAGLVKMQLVSAQRRVGLSKSKMPALEAFGRTATRVESTKIALEDIKETIKKAVEAIVAAFKRAIAWVKEFFAKMFDAATKLKSRVEKLKGLTSKMEGAPAAATMKAERVVKVLGVAGKISADVGGDVEKVVEHGLGDFATKKFSYLEGVVKAVGEKGANLETAIGALTIPMFGDSGKKYPGNVSIETSKVAGDLAIVSLAAANVGDASKVEVPVLDKAAAEKMLASAEKILTVVGGFKDHLKTSEMLKTDAIKQAEAIGKAADKAPNASEQMKVLRQVAKSADMPFAALSKYALGTVKGMTDYVELSIKQFGGKKTEEKAAA